MTYQVYLLCIMLVHVPLADFIISNINPNGHTAFSFFILLIDYLTMPLSTK